MHLDLKESLLWKILEIDIFDDAEAFVLIGQSSGRMVESWIIHLRFFALPGSSRAKAACSRRAVTGVSFLMTAFILRAGVRSMRATLTCRATLIANRFIGPTILLEFNAILYDGCRKMANRSDENRSIEPYAPLTRYFPM